MSISFEQHLKATGGIREALHKLYPEKKLSEQTKKEKDKDTKK